MTDEKKSKNSPRYWEKIVDRFSKEALESYEIHKCNSYLPCLPVDHNRIIFVTCKEKYKNQLRWPTRLPNCNTKFGDDYFGLNKIHMLCPLDCAIRGSAYDGGERYHKIKEETKHIKLKQPFRKHLEKRDFQKRKDRKWLHKIACFFFGCWMVDCPDGSGEQFCERGCGK